jgi:hypothetical protein
MRGSGSVFLSGQNDPYWWGRFYVPVVRHGMSYRTQVRIRIGAGTVLSEEEARARFEVLRLQEVAKRETIAALAQRAKFTGKRSGAAFVRNASRGVVAELVVAKDLLERGFEVFRAVSPQSPFDLVLYVHGEFYRVEVKCGSVSESGKPVCASFRNRGKFDVLAVVDENETVHYFTPDDSALFKTELSQISGLEACGA